MKNYIVIAIIIILVFVAGASVVFASETNGTIDSVYKYAWGENIGWVNFGCDNCNISITDSGLSGYALSETVGWLYLGDVSNDGEGNLSGYAWGENVGWVKFNPTNGGVVINSSGQFTGSALGENTGWIIFDCSASACVTTDWRPQSARTVSAPSGGGGMPAAWNNPPKAPENGFSVLINSGTNYAGSPDVALDLFGGPDTARMAISNFSDFHDAGQEQYQTTKQWNLCQGKSACNEGEYAVYAKFYAPWGASSAAVSDSIIYQTEKPIIERIKEIPEQIAKIPEILAPFIPELFTPEPPAPEPPALSIEELTPKEAPLALQGAWQLLPQEPIREFALAPLPREIRNLAQKFPELEKTFQEVGITKITDVAKLKTATLSLPELKETEEMPAEIVFAKTGGKLIDLTIALSITEKGEPQQKIAIISGKPLQLVVKPGEAVKSVKGYLVFRSKASQSTSLELPLHSLLASLIFANPVFAQTQKQPVRVEEKLVLLEFEYTDPDGDGIYTAEIQTPLVDGEYEIITVMDFEDPELGKKEIRLITVIDPEGYIYERDGNKETRIPGAIVSLFWLNPETKQYELWPAQEYQQENPQITDIRGTYSFLAPEGHYYIKAETPGYLMYEGKAFQLKEGSGIHINIELKTKYWLLKIIDWKTTLLIAVIMLLLYNFYRDRTREKLLFRKGSS